MRLLFLILIVTSCACTAVFSQDTIPKPKIDLSNLSIEELMNLDVYTAGKKYEKIIEAPAIMSVATKEDMHKWGAVTLIDVLKFLPGIEVTIDSKGYYNVAIRGINKTGNILLLVNGQTINDFYSGLPVYDLPVDVLERVEVIRGPGSALYGTNAMVGVINVTTIDETSVSASYGMNNMASVSGAYNIDKEHFHLASFIGFQNNTTSNAIVQEDKASDELWSLTNGTKTFETQRWNQDLISGINLKYKDFSINLNNIYRQRGAYVGPLHIASPDSKISHNRFLANLSYDFRISDNVIITPKLYYNNYNNMNEFQEAPDNYVSDISGDTFTNGKISKEKYFGVTYGAEMDIQIKASDNFEILNCAIFEDSRVMDYELTRNYNSITENYYGSFANYNDLTYTQKDKKRYVFAYLFQGRYTYKKLILTTGLRYDDYSDFGQSLNPRIGATYNFTNRFRVKGLYGKAFRAPTFQELYDNTLTGNDVGVKGNENLTPEIINTVELAFEYNFDKIYLKYNAFYVKNSNLIRVYDTYGSGGIGEYRNIGDVDYIGNEAECVINLFKGFNFFANYSQLINRFYWDENNVNEADVVYLSKKPNFSRELRNLPTIRINAGLSYNIKKIRFFVGGNFGNPLENNRRFYLENSRFVDIPYYVTVSTNVIYAPLDKLSIQLAVNNIGTKYAAPDESTDINAYGEQGLIQPGLMAFLKLNYKIR